MRYLSYLSPTKLLFNPASPSIMHIDLNSCFATVEQQANPLLRGKPVAVAAYTTPNGCIIAPSVEAKRRGIKLGMRVREGKAIDPHLVILPPDPWKYRYINRKLLTLFRQYTANITVKSIDEMVLSLKHAPAYSRGMETVAREIKQRIKREIGDWLTVSVGIGPSRFLAKLGSSLHKPDGLDVISSENFQSVYANLKLDNLHGIKLRNMIRLNMAGIYTVRQMYEAPVQRLKSAFHSILGYYWYVRLRGYEIDDAEFSRKSYGQSYAIYRATADDTELARLFCKLVEKMGRRMRMGGYAARGIHCFLQYIDYSFWHQGKTLPELIYASADIFRETMKLCRSAPVKKPVRLIAVSCFHLGKNPLCQLSLFSDEQKKRSLTLALDRISERFGNFIIYPATMLGTNDKVPDRIAFGGIRELEEFVFQGV